MTKHKLILPQTTVELKGSDLVITHTRTTMQTTIPAARLDAWCVSQLRKELVSPNEPSDTHVAGADSMMGGLDK